MMKVSRNTISALVITVMIASVFALPALSNDYAVDAATKKVKITYNANGGKFSAKKYAKKKSYTQKIKKGKKLGKLPKVTRDGYSLKGWYTKKSKGKKVTSKTKANKKMTLTALWTAKTYKVTFDSQGGSATRSIQVKYNGKYGELITPSRGYYDFVGWYTDKTGGEKVTADSIYKTAGDTTLYARWEYQPIEQHYLDCMGKTVSEVEGILGVKLGQPFPRVYSYANKDVEFRFKDDKCFYILGNDILNMKFSKFDKSKLVLKETYIPDPNAPKEFDKRFLSYQLGNNYLVYAIDNFVMDDNIVIHNEGKQIILTNMIYSDCDKFLHPNQQ